MSDRPIEPQNYSVGVNVVDIGEVRVARGRARYSRRCCDHRRMVYDPNERRVWCSNCESTIEAFDAFTALVDMHHVAQNKYSRREEAVKEAEAASIDLIACKNLQKEFRKKSTVPCCPHCNGGLLAEDFNEPIAKKSRALELQRRKADLVEV